ncbi:cyclase-like protein [Nocardia nova SH22a]|uniref:Cyclase-like protein n=1 Tax=Nocardia nova SH22a TaxID=1415166 RepID=W5TB04_9NOCA|nr:cyclase family protein [Nocardia nova]AHH16352.1 cyclase-like protein [Nocardia nova SH22a]
MTGSPVRNLSHPLSTTRVSLFPGDPPLRIETVSTLADDGYLLRTVTVGEHTGTHWGAPAHFTAGAATADELDAGDFVLPGVVVDIAERAARDRDCVLTVEDLLTWQDRHGPFPAEAAVLLHTGWDKYWGTADFSGMDASGRLHQPGFSVAAAHWLLDHGVLGRRGALGTDTFGPDAGTDDTFQVSKLLYREHRLSLEILTGLGDLPARDFTVVVGGFVAAGGSGSPATIYALLDR